MSRTTQTVLAHLRRLSGQARIPHFYFFVVACSVLVASAMGAILLVQYRDQMASWRHKLNRVADINQQVLEHWVSEREDDARLLASFPCVRIAAVNQISSLPRRPRVWEQQLHNELSSVVNTYDYAGAYVLDYAGRIKGQSDDAPPLPPEVVQAVARRSGKPIVTIAAPGGGAVYSQLALRTLIPHAQEASRNTEPARPIGYVVLLTRPEAIGKLLLADAAATATGETVLVALKAGEPAFISPLRHFKARRAPPPPLQGPARIALRQKTAFFGEYRDYRDTPVLAAARFLPKMEWGMVTKVDRAEALAAFERTFVFAAGITLAFLLSAGLAALAWLRQQRIQRLRAELALGKETENKLRESEERFWMALQNSPIVMFSQDRQLRYTWIHNPQRPWSDVDYRGRTDEEIIGDADGRALSALKRPVLETGIGTRTEWSFVYAGQRRHYDINIQPLRGPDGDIVGVTCAATDITERKRAEERLREYAKAVEGLEEMIVVVDRDYRYLIANRAFLKYRGLKREQLIGRSVAEVLNPGVFESAVKSKLDQCLRDNVVTYELKYTYPTLGERDLFLSYFPIEGPNGVDRVACVLQDITERKRATEALKASEARYRLMFERNPAGMYRCTLEGKILDCNQAFARIVGCDSREEVLQLPITHFYRDPQQRASVLRRLRAEGCLTNYEFCGRRKDGAPIWILLNATLVAGENGAPSLLEGAFVDITARKLAEEALHRSEAQLRAFIERAPYGIFRCAGGRFLSANPALIRMLGYAGEADVTALELPGELFADPSECRDLLKVWANEGHFGPIEAHWKRADGRPLLVRLSGCSSKHESGKQDIVEAIVEDITQQRAVEEHLRQADKMEALGRLAGGVAHDFNNLLLCITLILERVIAQPDSRNPVLRRELQEALQAARSASALTRELLVLGRRRPFKQQAVDLNDVVRGTQDLAKRLAGENVHLTVRLGQQLGTVLADPAQLQQVFLNLVANARDAMPCGGQITIQTAVADLEYAPAEEYFTAAPLAGSYVVLEISDTGIGISKENLDHIFEPFYTTKEEGSGLGLPTSYAIVNQSEGYISVRSAPGRGTTVRVYLPRREAGAALAKAAS